MMKQKNYQKALDIFPFSNSARSSLIEIDKKTK